MAAFDIQRGSDGRTVAGQHHHVSGHVAAADLDEEARPVAIHPKGCLPDTEGAINVHEQCVEEELFVVRIVGGGDGGVKVNLRLAYQRLLLLKKTKQLPAEVAQTG